VHREIPRPAGENAGLRNDAAYERRKLKPLPGIEIKNSSPLLSIFPVRDDYRMNDAARKAMLLAPTEAEERGEEQ
jgi:hypothetical protein